MSDAISSFLRPERDQVRIQESLREHAERLLAEDSKRPEATGQIYRIYSPSHPRISTFPVTLAEARVLFDQYEERYGEDNVDIAIQRMVWITVN